MAEWSKAPVLKTGDVTERYAHMAPDSGSGAIPLLEEALRLDPRDVIQESLATLKITEQHGRPDAS